MEENDIKKLRKIPGFGDLKSFRFLVEKMYTELEAQPEKEKKMVAQLLGESLHELDVVGKHAFSASHPIDFSDVYNTYEHLYTIVQKYHYLLMLSNDSTLSALRNRGKKLGNLSDLKEKLVSALADVAMLSLDEGGSKKKKVDQMIEAQKRLNELRNVIFSYITSSPMWDEDEAKEYQELLHSTAVDSVTAQLMVSAITLSCLYFFDRKKFQFLFKLAKESEDMQVRVRAWVGWVLCSSQVPGFMVEECAKDIESLKEDEEGKKLLLLISKILLRSQDMKEDSEAMMKNMFHNMADKLSHEDIDLEGKSSFSFIQKDDDDEDEPEDGRDVDETVELLEDGADIYFTQFRETKKLGFFHSMYNWFMPFYFESPLYLSVQEMAGDKERNLHLLLENGTACDSDRYSLLLMLEKEKKSFTEALENMAPDEVAEEYLNSMDEDEAAGFNEEEKKYLEKKKLHTAVIYYIQDLSRFFNLAPMRKAYDNSIKRDAEDELYTTLVLPIFEDAAFDELRYKMARYCFKRNCQNFIFDLMGNHYPDTVESHYLLAWAAVKSKAKENVVLAYPHIDYLMKNEPGQFQLVEMAVDFYERVASYENVSAYQKAVDCLIHLMEIKKDDEKALLWCKKRLAKIYVLMERYEDAVKLFYEITYLEPDNLTAAANLAEALLYMDGDDQKNLEKIENILKSGKKKLIHLRRDNFKFDSFPDDPKGGLATFFSAMSACLNMDFMVDFELYRVDGMLWWARDDREKAMKSWQRAYEARSMAHQEGQLFDEKQGKWLSAHGINENMRIYLEELMAQKIRQSMKKMMDQFGHDEMKDNGE